MQKHLQVLRTRRRKPYIASSLNHKRIISDLERFRLTNLTSRESSLNTLLAFKMFTTGSKLMNRLRNTDTKEKCDTVIAMS